MIVLNKLLRFTMTLSPMALDDLCSVRRAVDLLKKGGVIALPTDTVYGFACCATNATAVNKLYSIKSRNESKPVAICVGEERDMHTWSKTEHLPPELINTLLPGPVTLILKSQADLVSSVVHNGKIAIRIPDYDFIRDVAKGLGRPLALTSANVSEAPSSVKIDEFKELWEKLDGVFDGGDLGDSNRGASTIVDFSEPGIFKIVRKGIALEETLRILKGFDIEECS